MSQDAVSLTLGHSPDPDDAFMWWPLVGLDGRGPAIDTGRFRFELIQQDIQSLNERSLGGELDITAISCAHYPHVSSIYAITSCGTSMGDGFGPKLVARRPRSIDDLRRARLTVAIPGERTTAFAVMCIMLGGRDSCCWETVPFEQIIERVASGEFEAGLIIHEGQLTFEQAGLHLIADVANWWKEQHGLPLPLGINTIRRDLEPRFGRRAGREIVSILTRSIRHAMSHREQGLQYAAGFARGMSPVQIDRFVGLYVNDWTIELGSNGERAIRALFTEMTRCGLAPDRPVDIVGC